MHRRTRQPRDRVSFGTQDDFQVKQFQGAGSPSRLEACAEDESAQAPAGSTGNRFSLISFGAVGWPGGQGAEHDRGSLSLHPQRISTTSFGQVAGVKRDSAREEELPFEAPLFDIELRDDPEEVSSESEDETRPEEEGDSTDPFNEESESSGRED